MSSHRGNSPVHVAPTHPVGRDIAPDSRLFQSYFIGGFECSTHKLPSGKRLDLIAATGHDVHAERDYAALHAHGIRTVRDGIRWHLIEQASGRYNWSSVLPMVRAAHRTGTQVIWDLCHYGWPDDLDVFSAEFVRRFAVLSRIFARIISEETDVPHLFSPVNEISFFAWAGGGASWLNPFAPGRADELKQQLVRAAIESIEAIWSVIPGARIVHTDPVLNIVTHPERPEDEPHARGHHEAQFQAWEMLSGRRWTYLGGDPKYLDILGLNYYGQNQWIHGGPVISRGHPQYSLFRHILADVYARYGRPMFVAETGAEGDERAPWLRYISEEVRAACSTGVPVEGICLYPVLDYPGWDDDRHCPSGLLGYPDADGKRDICLPFAAELRRQSTLLASRNYPTQY